MSINILILVDIDLKCYPNMEQVRKYELTRAAQHLQRAVNNIHPSLFEDLQLDEDVAIANKQVKDRGKALNTAHRTLSRECEFATQAREAAMQHALEQETEEARRALVGDYLTHWSASGGEAAEDAVSDLLSRLEVAMQSLFKDNINAWSTPALRASLQVRPIAFTPSRPLCRAEEELFQEQENRAREVTPLLGSVHPASLRSKQRSNDPNNTSFDRVKHDQAVRLPAFDLPVFTGDIAKFAEFWDIFDSAVHSNRTIPPTVKFHYLRTSLQGDALSMVAGYDITDANYELAVNTLRETYFRPEFIRMQLSIRLQQLKPATLSALNQRITLAQVKSLWLQLKKFGDHDENIFVLRIIREKFPSKTLERVGQIQANDSSSWGVSQLLDALDQVVRTFEVVEDSVPTKTLPSEALNLHTVRRSSSRESSLSNTSSRGRRRRQRFSSHDIRRRISYASLRCVFCKSLHHRTSHCNRVTSIRVRWAIVHEERLCFKCFAQSHRAEECDKPSCPECQGGHHKMLCCKVAERSYRSTRNRSSTRRSSLAHREEEISASCQSLKERGRSSQRKNFSSCQRTTSRGHPQSSRSARTHREDELSDSEYVDTDEDLSL